MLFKSFLNERIEKWLKPEEFPIIAFKSLYLPYG